MTWAHQRMQPKDTPEAEPFYLRGRGLFIMQESKEAASLWAAFP
jgi:hypothetical protein